MRALLILALGLALGLLPGTGWPVDDLEQRLKVAYLYNFTRYVDWPDDSVGDAFVIAVVGDPALAGALRTLEQSHKQAEGRPIRVRTLDDALGANDAQILFIGAAALADLPRILARTQHKPVLLVGDSVGLARQGVAINFFLKADILGAGAQLRFQINPAALEGRGLEVKADLYDVAEVIR